MTNPSTLAEARKRTYGDGSMYGTSKYEEGRCAESVFSDFFTHQCTRKNGYGPGKLYCKQHAMKLGAVDESVSADKRYVYGFDEDDKKLVKVKVLKITEEKVFIESNSAFRYRSSITTGAACFTKRKALEALVIRARQKLMEAERNVKACRKKLAAAERMLRDG